MHGGPARRGTAHGRVGACRVDRRFSLGFRRSSTYGKARWRAPMCTAPPVRTWERAINLEDSCETAESQQKPAPFLSDRLSPMCVPPSPGRESLPHPHPGTDRPAAHSAYSAAPLAKTVCIPPQPAVEAVCSSRHCPHAFGDQRTRATAPPGREPPWMPAGRTRDSTSGPGTPPPGRRSADRPAHGPQASHG